MSVPAVSGRPGLCPSLGHHLVAPFLSCHPCRWHFRWFASFARSGKPLALARPELPHFLPFLPSHRKMPLHAHEPCLGVSFSAKVKNSTRSERCEQALPFKLCLSNGTNHRKTIKNPERNQTTRDYEASRRYTCFFPCTPPNSSGASCLRAEATQPRWSCITNMPLDTRADSQLQIQHIKFCLGHW